MRFIVTPESVTALPVCGVRPLLIRLAPVAPDFRSSRCPANSPYARNESATVFVFEPASQQSKYGPVPPDYDDRDERSIVDYNLGMLGGLFCVKKVEFVAPTPASRSEKVHYLFSIQMTPQRLQANNGIRLKPEQILR